MHFLSLLHRPLDSIAVNVQVLLQAGYSMNVLPESQVLYRKLKIFGCCCEELGKRKYVVGDPALRLNLPAGRHQRQKRYFSYGFFFPSTSFLMKPANRSLRVFSCFAVNIQSKYSFLLEYDNSWNALDAFGVFLRRRLI